MTNKEKYKGKQPGTSLDATESVERVFEKKNREECQEYHSVYIFLAI